VRYDHGAIHRNQGLEGVARIWGIVGALPAAGLIVMAIWATLACAPC
jgi:hypothetical protein